MTTRFCFTRLCLTGAVALVVAVSAVGPAAAQDMQNLVNRLNRMERDMQDMQRQLYRGSGGSATGITATPVTPAQTGSGATSAPGEPLDSNYAARVEVRLQQLETVLRDLTGKIEEVQFKTQQNSDRIDRLVRDVDFRLQALEKGGVKPGASVGDASSQSPSASAGASGDTSTTGQKQGVLGILKGADAQALESGNTGAPAAASEGTNVASAASSDQLLPDGTPEEQYKHAFEYLQKQDFDNAEKALKLFLEKNPKSPLAGNAMYWLGETYYVRKDFANAAKTFAAGYTDYQGSSKTPDNLLKLGLSLARMDRKQDACVTLDQLKADFPNASANIKRRAETERNRLGC